MAERVVGHFDLKTGYLPNAVKAQPTFVPCLGCFVLVAGSLRSGRPLDVDRRRRRRVVHRGRRVIIPGTRGVAVRQAVGIVQHSGHHEEPGPVTISRSHMMTAMAMLSMSCGHRHKSSNGNRCENAFFHGTLLFRIGKTTCTKWNCTPKTTSGQ